MISNHKVLIVDDHKANRELLNDLIQALGHFPLMAENGLSALALIRRDPPPKKQVLLYRGLTKKLAPK